LHCGRKRHLSEGNAAGERIADRGAAPAAVRMPVTSTPFFAKKPLSMATA